MPHFSPRIAAHLLRLPLSLSTACLGGGVLAVSSPTASAEESISYERDVRPILKRRCFACHGALKQKAELRLDTVATMLSGGDSQQMHRDLPLPNSPDRASKRFIVES